MEGQALPDERVHQRLGDAQRRPAALGALQALADLTAVALENVRVTREPDARSLKR
jgi:hypothetical protein